MRYSILRKSLLATSAASLRNSDRACAVEVDESAIRSARPGDGDGDGDGNGDGDRVGVDVDVAVTDPSGRSFLHAERRSIL